MLTRIQAVREQIDRAEPELDHARERLHQVAVLARYAQEHRRDGAGPVEAMDRILGDVTADGSRLERTITDLGTRSADAAAYAHILARAGQPGPRHHRSAIGKARAGAWGAAMSTANPRHLHAWLPAALESGTWDAHAHRQAVRARLADVEVLAEATTDPWVGRRVVIDQAVDLRRALLDQAEQVRQVPGSPASTHRRPRRDDGHRRVFWQRWRPCRGRGRLVPCWPPCWARLLVLFGHSQGHWSTSRT